MDDEPICHCCVKDEFLVALILEEGESAECSICAGCRQTLPLGRLVDLVDDILQQHFEPGFSHPVHNEEGDFSHTQQKGEFLIFHIAELIGVDEDDPLAMRICTELTECSLYDLHQGGEAKYDEDCRYVHSQIRSREAERRWEAFKADMKHGNRFFNSNAKVFLDWLFLGIESFKVYSNGQTVVRHLEKEALYRARRCDSVTQYEVILEHGAKELGPPPKEYAGSGRMNPEGVPAFYAALDRQTSVAELRPPVGGRLVSGEFKLTRPVRVLDFKILEKAYEAHPLSMFDPGYSEKVERRSFLQTLHGKITVPVLPNQKHEYLATQVMAEYLATQFDPPLDGVVFASAQVANGTNVTLFNHALATSADSVTMRFGLSVDGAGHQPHQPAIEYIPDSMIRHVVKEVVFCTDDLPRDDNQPESEDHDDYWDEC